MSQPSIDLSKTTASPNDTPVAVRGRSITRIVGTQARSLIPPLLVIVAVLVVWQLVVDLRNVSEFVLPTPTAIWSALVNNKGVMLEATKTTTYEVVVGFVIANALAVVIACLLVWSRMIRRAVYPLLIVTQVVPKIALAPLFLIWFGAGTTPKIIITIVMCFFPTAVNTTQGMEAVDHNAEDLMKLVYANRMQVFWRLQFPTALPAFFSGLKVSMTLAVVGAIVGEWIGASSGLGYLILYSTQTIRTDLVFAAIFVVSLLGIVLYVLVGVAERIFSWSSSSAPVGGY